MHLQNNYIELNRQFVEINEKDIEISDIEARIELGLTSASNWSDLLAQHRVVILSSAGTGKTYELFYQCENLRRDNKIAFFLRLEDLATNWVVSFEIGNPKSLKKAVKAGDEIWIFLDSIDEARLYDSRAFEKALKQLKLHIKDTLQNVHMVLTSRVGAWRPKSDAALLDSLFPYDMPKKFSSEQWEDDYSNIEWNDDVESELITPEIEGGTNSPIKCYTLLHLDSEQIQIFAEKRGLNDACTFVSEIQHPNLQGLAGRPKDLDDLIQFWRKHGRMGNRREIVEKNMERKLKEDDPDRASRDSLFFKKTIAGVKKLAAATVLTHLTKVIVPDQSLSNGGVNIQSVLEDWSYTECLNLLGRPIFEPETYGFVRFDHRDTREFLAANWFFDLLERGQSRMRVEQLFFKTQYGIKVVVPSLRPLLPWLAILDYEIRRRVIDSWPEILLEGGDPSELPLPNREELLNLFSARHAIPESQFSVDLNALQRLITPELSPAIRRLYLEYKGNEKIEILLLRCIELGSLNDLADIAEAAALENSRGTNIRLAAMRAVSVVCDEKKITSVCGAILQDNGLTSREELANVLDVFGAKFIPVNSLMHLVKMVEPKDRYSSGRLNRAIIEYINTCTISDVICIVSESARLIKQAPFNNEYFLEVSEKYSWVLDFAITACKRLVQERHPVALDNLCLSLLSLTKNLHDYNSSEIKTELGELIPQWPELNAALFWYVVEELRMLQKNKNGESLVDWWQVERFQYLWRFKYEDIDQVVKWVTRKEFIDDRLVALTLAFSIYRDIDRPRSLRRHLWKVVEGNTKLSATLKLLLNPPAMSDERKRYMRRIADRERRKKTLERKEVEYHEKLRKEIPNLLEYIRDARAPTEGGVYYFQLFLFHRMQCLNEKHYHSAQTNWQDLKADFGGEVAEAMRDGLMAIWRRHTPTLASESGTCNNQVTFMESMALSGLEIEFRENPDSPISLNHNEARRAARYLTCELNGFPRWFRAFEEQYPDITLSVLLKEINWELFENPSDNPSDYLLERVLSNATWFGDRIAKQIVTLLENEPKHIRILGYAMKLILDCDAIENNQIAKLCTRKIADATIPRAHNPLWFAAWVSVDPIPAIKDLTTKLAALEVEEAVEVAIAFINALCGSSIDYTLDVRDGHKTPEHLKNLCILMHQYIRRDDINHSNGLAYTPNSGDYAHDALGYIYDTLAEISGKDAFDALISIAQEESSEHIRARLCSSAVARAQADADVPWKIDDINDFADELERTPSNPRELFEIATNRLMDLKYNYEEGDTSPYKVLIKIDQETELRNYLANWLRETAHARYSISQEEEMPNSQRTDIRFGRTNIPGMVPVELKIAHKWSGPQLFEKLKDQLCGDYLRDMESTNGIYLLFYSGKQNTWRHPDSNNCLTFDELIAELQCYANDIVASCWGISNIKVIGVDLIKRGHSEQK